MAKVAHLNVVTIYDVGVLGDTVFVAMERVAGPTLRQWLRERRRPWREILDLLIGAGRGLAAIHEAGIIHRDFKPSNVLVGADGIPKVADFGLAKLVDEENGEKSGEDDGAEPRRRRILRGAGTPGYKSPEQLRLEGSGVGSDVYAFSVTLFEALYGELPFAGASDEERAARIESGERPPRPDGSSVPSSIDEVIDRGLRGAVEERWPTMEALLQALSQARKGRSSRILGLSLAALAVLLLVALRPLPSACASSEELLSGLWDGARRSTIEATLRSEGAGIGEDGATIVAKGLERYAGSYVEARHEVCTAGEDGELSDWQAALVSACLDDRRATFSALLGLLHARGESIAPEAAGLVERIETPTSCLSLAAQEPTDPAPGESHEPLVEAELEALSVAVLAEQEEVAAELIERLGGARGPRSPELKNRLHQLRGSYYCLIGESERCVSIFRQALQESLRMGLDIHAARAAIALMRESDDGGLLALHAYDDLAASLIERAELDGGELDLIRRLTAVRTRTRIESQRAVWPAIEELVQDIRTRPKIRPHVRLAIYVSAINVGLMVGAAAKSAALAEEALEIARRERGRSHPLIRDLLAEAVQAKTAVGDTTAALELADELVLLSRAAHDDIATALWTRAIANERAGRVKEELEDLRSAVEACAVEPCSPTLRLHLANSLGVVLDAQGEYAEARSLLEGALAGPREGVQASSLLFARLSLADVELHSGRLDQARALFEGALPDLEAEFGKDGTYSLYGDRGLALVDLADGNAMAARSRLADNLDRLVEESMPWERAMTLFAFARALEESAESDVERLESLVRAKEAAAIYRGLAPGFVDELAVVETWLTEHSRS